MRLVATTSASTCTGPCTPSASAIRRETSHDALWPQRALVDERGVALQQVRTRFEPPAGVVDRRDPADPDQGEVRSDATAKESYDVLRPLRQRLTAEPSRPDPIDRR